MLFSAEGVELLVFLMNFTTFQLYIVINNNFYIFTQILTINSGYAECRSIFEEQDLQFCKQYSAVKPAPAGIVFRVSRYLNV